MSGAPGIDVAVNRTARKWSRREQASQVFWALAWPLFRFSPRPLWGWRRMLLRVFGAKLAPNMHVYSGAPRVWMRAIKAHESGPAAYTAICHSLVEGRS